MEVFSGLGSERFWFYNKISCQSIRNILSPVFYLVILKGGGILFLPAFSNVLLLRWEDLFIFREAYHQRSFINHSYK